MLLCHTGSIDSKLHPTRIQELGVFVHLVGFDYTSSEAVFLSTGSGQLIGDAFISSKSLHQAARLSLRTEHLVHTSA